MESHPTTGTPSDDFVITATLTNKTFTVEATAILTVCNVDPVITSLSAPMINENDFAVVTGSFSDVGTLDTHTVEIDWGDGTTSPAVVD